LVLFEWQSKQETFSTPSPAKIFFNIFKTGLCFFCNVFLTIPEPVYSFPVPIMQSYS